MLLSARPLHRIVQLHHRHLAATITASGREGIDCCFARRLSKRRPYDLELVSSLIRRAFHNPGSPPWIHRRVEPVAKSLRSLRSEEHTSELQSRGHLVCRLLLEKKKQQQTTLTTK